MSSVSIHSHLRPSSKMGYRDTISQSRWRASAPPQVSPKAVSLPNISWQTIQSPGGQSTPSLIIEGNQVALDKKNIIGKGGMGTIHRLFVDGRDLAAKYVSMGILAKYLKREAAFGANLNGTGFPTVYGVVENGENEAVMIMDFVPGRSAYQWGKKEYKSGLPLGIALKSLTAVCRQLNAAHKQGIIHRDIKPENVMIAIDNNAFTSSTLIDLGLATTDELQRETQKELGRTVVAGTPAFMSPEQARGEIVDQRSDIYALGATYYEIITGISAANPARNIADFEILRKLASGTIMPDLTKLPVEARPIFRKMMDPNPANRYQNCFELSLALCGLSVDLGIDLQ